MIQASQIQFVAGVAAACLLSAAVAAQDLERYRDPRLPESAPFSNAVVVGETIYVAGHIGNRRGTVEIVEGGVGAETTQMLENVRETLTAVGAELSDIAACTIYLADIGDYAEMNAAYAPFFPEGFPARAAIGVNELVFGASVEIECVAHRAPSPE